MTDNTQVGLKRWCEAFIDGDISAGQFKRAVRTWHNKQTLELLDRLELRVKVADATERFTTALGVIEAERKKVKEAEL